MNIPTPNPDESFDHYSITAQRALFREIPDPFERMGTIRRTWRQHRGLTPEEELADRKFSPDKYQKAEDVCVFAEHETTDSQGQPRKYDLRKLARIVRYCNERALESEAFAAIAEQHTDDSKGPNKFEPRVLGYAGPYRLGLTGRNKPTWAIFTDEYRFPGEARTFGQKNRRSVELWTDRRTGRMWFDPITTCGADAPRLPLPARYAMVNRDGVELERYTAEAAFERYTAAAGGFATAGLGSTSVPSHKAAKPISTPKLDPDNYEAGQGAPAMPATVPVPDKRHDPSKDPPLYPKKGNFAQMVAGRPGDKRHEPSGDFSPIPPPVQKYDAELGAPTQEPNAGGNAMDGMNGSCPPTLEQIVEAVMSLPPMQWASQQMAQQPPGPGGMDELSPASAPPAAPPAAPPPGPGGPPAAPPPDGPSGDDSLGDLDDVLGDDDQPPGGPPETEDPTKEKEKNSMAYSAPADLQLEVQRYKAELSKYQASHERVIRDLGRSQERLMVLERETTDAKRQARIAKLRADHPAFPIDEDDIKPTLYSMGGNMNDQEFERHVATLEKYAARFVQPVNLPEGEAARSEPEAEKQQYAAKLSREAVRIATAAADAGKSMTWDEAYAKAQDALKQ